MDSLAGQLLVAMPGMGDPRFARAVVLICSHDKDGAMGLIVNKPADDMRLMHLLDHLDMDPGEDAPDLPVHIGGPVEMGRGFVLHTPGGEGDVIDGKFEISTTMGVLRDIARGRGPGKVLMALGYAGWSPGQLEGELAESAWLMIEATARLVWEVPDARKWSAALAAIGVDPRSLSMTGGTA